MLRRERAGCGRKGGKERRTQKLDNLGRGWVAKLVLEDNCVQEN